MTTKLNCVAGLHRSGTTLLCSMLDQSPETYIEGTSGLVSLVASVFENCLGNNDCSVYIKSQNREKKTLLSVVPAVINAFYKEVPDEKIVIDKSRGWNKEILIRHMQKYSGINAKVVCLYRPLGEIIKSFALLIEEEKRENFCKQIMHPSSSVMSACEELIEAIKSKNKNYLFVAYDDLVNDTEDTFGEICDFFELKRYSVNEANLSEYSKEPNQTQGIVGLHKVKNNIFKRNNETVIPSYLDKICSNVDSKINAAFTEAKRYAL